MKCTPSARVDNFSIRKANEGLLIAITNIVWCIAYNRGVGGKAYIAQWSCNSIAVG